MNFASLTSPNPGAITSTVDLNKNITTYSYGDGSHPTRVTSINDGEGRTLYFSYNPDGQPAEVSMQVNTSSSPTRYVTFSYQNNSNTNPATFNPLVQITDAMGNSQYFTYDSVTNQIAGRYDTRNNPATLGSSALAMTAYTYVGSGSFAGYVSTEQIYNELLRTYFYQNITAADGTANLLIAIDEEDIATSTHRYSATLYNQWSQPVQAWGPTTTSFTLPWAPSPTDISPFTGSVITWSFEYQDPLNVYLMTQMVDPNLNTTRWVFDDFGNTTQMIDPFSNKTVYTYGSGISPYLLTQISPPAIQAVGDTMPTIHSTNLNYDSVGNLSSIQDAAGNSISFTRDNLSHTGTYASVPDGRITKVTDRNTQTTLIAYTNKSDGVNNTGNVSSVTFPTGSAMTGELSFTYDIYDNRLTSSDSINSVSYTWDNLQRLLSVIPTISGTTTTWSYLQDRLNSIQLPDTAGLSGGVGGTSGGRKTSFQYDTPSRVIEVDSQSGPSLGTTQPRVYYNYDGWSNLTKLGRVGQAGSRVDYQFTYDVLDRALSMQSPRTRTTSNSYAPYCHSYTQTTPRSITRTYTLDALCRLTQVAMGDEVNSISYDSWGQVTQIVHQPSEFSTLTSQNPAIFGSARFNTVSSPQTKNFLYDNLGRLTEISYNSGAKTIQYGYDAEGNVTSVQDTSSVSTGYLYYNDYKLKTVTVGSQVFTYYYDSAGRLHEIDYPTSPVIKACFYNPSTGVSYWDANGRLLGIAYTKGGSPLQSFTYSYDSSGNRSGCVDTSSAEGTTTTWSYGYDYFGRLKGADNGTRRNVYSYDESDNRIQLAQTPAPPGTTLDYQYDDDNELHYRYLDGNAPTSGDSWTFDSDGNLQSKTVSGATSQLIFNDSNKLVRVALNGIEEQVSSYDAEGLRESKNTSTLYYNSDSTALSESPPSGPVSFIQGHQLLGFQSGGSFYFYLTDALGSVRHVVDSSGNVVYSFVYDEFGQQMGSTDNTGGNATLQGLCQLMTFVGAYGVRNETAATGMLLMGQRWYDPTVGRFVSQDPIGFAGGLNLYGYVGQNPIGRIDPSGLVFGADDVLEALLVEEAIDVAIPVAERLAPAVGRALYARYAGLAALVTGTYGLAGVGIYVAAQRLAAQQTSLANVTPGDCPNQGGEPIYHWRNKTWRGSGFKGEHFIQRIYQTTGTNPEGFQQDYLDDGRSQYIGKGDIAPRQMWRILPAEGPTVRMSVDPTITNASGTMVNGTLMTVLPNQR